MRLSQRVRKILTYYEGESAGCKQNIARFLMHGRLSGTGKLLMLAVDQGFEHGPGRSFSMNPVAYDPHYHFRLAQDAALSGYAAPLGWLEAGSDTFVGAVPTILKINSGNTLLPKEGDPDQAVTASVQDALRLGCSAIGFTIYPGSGASLDQFEELRDLAAEAKACGLAVVVWSYPRGSISKAGEVGADVVAYGAHMAALLGAHIIKVKPPSAHLEQAETKAVLESNQVPLATLTDRIRFVVQSCFQGRRIVIFSGMEMTNAGDMLDDIRQIAAGGGFGSIVGRNAFKRPREEALDLLKSMQHIYRESLNLKV